MENSINNKNENRNETSADYELICSICNKPLNDPQSLSCGHTCCRQCIKQVIDENHLSCPICQQEVTINNFSEVNQIVLKNVNELSMKYNEDKQATLHSRNIHNPINEVSPAIDEHNLSSHITLNQNEQQNQYSATRPFEPFRNLLSDLINQNKQLRVEINQIKKQSQLQSTDQSRKNEELQLEIEQFKKQSQLQHQTLTEQLENVNNQYDLCLKRLNEQSKKNEGLQLELNQLNEQSQRQLTVQSRKNEQLQFGINQLYEKSAEHSTLIDRLQTDDQNQSAQILKTNQQHNLLEINVKSIRDYMRYLPDTKWKQPGITIAGGNGDGDKLNQLSHPEGIFIDDDQTIYIADCYNQRIVEWKRNGTSGQIVAGGNGQGNQTNQLYGPADVIIDKENNSLIIADRGNRRVMGLSRQNNTTNGQIIIEDIDCWGLTMDKNGSLYVSDWKKDEVRRWKRGEQNGTIVAGGHGQGNHLDQLDWPTFIFVDEDSSVYVSDHGNHRVVKWLKDAREGIIVAGGNGPGNSLKQLYRPRGLIVDRLGQIYVADCGKTRVTRWCPGAKEGTIVVGGNGEGAQSNQFNGPYGLSFDRQGNLYVADCWNHRIQKFKIN